MITHKFDDYLSKWGIKNRFIFNESIDAHTFSCMIVSIPLDEKEFNIKIKMDVSVSNCYGKSYVRHSLFISYDGCITDNEIFLQESLIGVNSIEEISSILVYSILYLKIYYCCKLSHSIDSIKSYILNNTRILENIVEDSKLIKDLQKELREVKDQRNDFFMEKERLNNVLKRKSQNPDVKKSDSKKAVCYIMVDEQTNYTKIGFSVSPEKRERTLQSEKPTIKLIHIFEENHERKLHNEYSNKRVRGEWFNLTDKEVSKIIKKYK